MKIPSVKGFHDVLPGESARWAALEERARAVFAQYNFHEIRLPIVERSELFQRSVGETTDIVEKEMYTFTDRDRSTLTLRPEGTASVVRAYVEHALHAREPVSKLYYFGPMFRYHRPQAGRYRQLWQFGVECIGDASPAADVEVIELQRFLYEQLGLGDLTLRINSIGTADTRHRYTEALREHFRPHVATLSRDSQRRFETNVLRVLDSKEDAGHPAVRRYTISARS